MSAKRRTTVGVIFGGRSVEHDVSVVTGNQVMRAFDEARYEVVPIYIDRDGKWFTGDPLRDIETYKRADLADIEDVQEAIISPAVQHHGLIINPLAKRFHKSAVKRLDVVFPALHGTHGEDGTVQGLFEMADLPYVGCGVLASALANDKIMTKTVLRQRGIPVIDDVTFSRAAWLDDPESIVRRITDALNYPLFIKPAKTGSSIGIGRADSEMLLRASIDIASHFDDRILVESAVRDSVEVNCAVMGSGDDVRASVLEQPVSWEQFLTYEEKYMHGSEGMKSADRLIPAPLDDGLMARIRESAIAAFRAVDGRGTARIDFFVQADRGAFYVNELNTMPGSLAFYLWQAEDMAAGAVVERLVRLAQEAHVEKRRNTYNYETNLIELTAARGLKGVKAAPARDAKPAS